METRVRRASLWPALLAVLPLLPSWWYALANPWPPMSADDDSAVIEMCQRRALHGAQLTGGYSRFGWSQPGPVQFYLMAPVYAATGGRSAGLDVAALFLSTLFTAAAGWTAARVLGTPQGVVAAAGLALLLARMGPGFPAHAWAPHAVVLPFALLLLLAVGLAREGAGWLPAVAAVTTFLVQTHLGTAPAAAAVVLGALVLAGRAGRRVLAPRPLLVAAAVLVALWAPPILEEARGTAGHPGNLTLLWRFFATQRPEHTFVEVFGRLAHELGSLPLALATAVVPSTTDRRDVGAGALALLLVALLPLGLAASRRRRDDDAALGWLSLAAIAAVFLSGFRIAGEIFDYLLLFASAASFGGWTALALAAARPLEERGRSRAVALVCALGVAACAISNARGLTQQQPIPIETKAAVRTFVPALRAHLAAEGIRRPLVVVTDGEPWVQAAGTLLELERVGLSWAVEERWTFLFGRDRRAGGAEDGSVLFTEESRPDLRQLAEFGKTKLYAVPAASR